MRQDYEEFVARDTVIVVVGPDGPDVVKKYWKENDLPFIGVPDPRHTVLKLFGQEVKLFKFGRMPAQVIIDKNGTARYVHYGHEMSDIPPNEEIISLLDELNKSK